MIPTARDTDSRSSPRNRRITTSRLRPAENRPPRPRPAATPVATDSSTCFLISTLLLRELSRNQVSKKTLGRRTTHSRPAPHSGGPSWLTFLGHAKDSLWSIDLFRCESAILRSHWVLVVMDQYTRRIVGFGIHAGTVDGRALCRMFNHAIRGLSRPKRLSSDNDPLYRFHQWCANLRVLQVTEVKSVPYVPLSHPFVERLIGTLRRECVDQLLFWSASDLEDKLVAFQDFYNAHRAHASLDGRTPVPIRKDVARLDRYRWDAHCRGLYQTPIAA